MPGYVVGDWQVQTLLGLAGIPEPSAASPLAGIARYPRAIAPGEPDWEPLERWGLVQPDGTGWRVNLVVAGVLRAAAHPDEVISVGVGEPDNPGFSVVRRGTAMAECTVGPSGTTKLHFPVTRRALVSVVLEALSPEDPGLLPSTGFVFLGSADEAFLLQVVMLQHRSDVVAPTVAAVRAAARQGASSRRMLEPYTATGTASIVSGLVDGNRVDQVLRRLVEAGHVVIEGDRVRPSDAAAAALGSWPLRVFGVTRVETVPVRSVVMLQAMWCGGRIITFRPVGARGEAMRYEWRDVTPAELRQLVAATLLPANQLAELAADVAGTDELALPPRSAAPGPPSGPSWQATHGVPVGGLDAYELPDPALAPIARLDAGLPVQVGEELGAWARVVCSNGWTAWVDGRRLDRRA